MMDTQLPGEEEQTYKYTWRNTHTCSTFVHDTYMYTVHVSVHEYTDIYKNILIYTRIYLDPEWKALSVVLLKPHLHVAHGDLVNWKTGNSCLTEAQNSDLRIPYVTVHTLHRWVKKGTRRLTVVAVFGWLLVHWLPLVFQCANDPTVKCKMHTLCETVLWMVPKGFIIHLHVGLFPLSSLNQANSTEHRQLTVYSILLGWL